MCVFNEARNNREAFYTASQRLTDFSKTIRSKQLPCIGKLSSEDITPNLRRIEKSSNLEFAKMPQKTWFFEGKTIVSPEFKQSGKPYQINGAIKQQWLVSLPKPKTLTEKIKAWFTPKPTQRQQFQHTTKTRIQQEPNDDPSVYSDDPRDTQEDDMEEDLALLDDSDMGW
ncbi:MAG: hypothetical protein ABSA75_05710 [Candidatus Bathyarchaeia archaeon]